MSGKNICRVNGALVTVAQLKGMENILLTFMDSMTTNLCLEAMAQVTYLDIFWEDPFARKGNISECTEKIQ